MRGLVFRSIAALAAVAMLAACGDSDSHDSAETVNHYAPTNAVPEVSTDLDALGLAVVVDGVGNYTVVDIQTGAGVPNLIPILVQIGGASNLTIVGVEYIPPEPVTPVAP